MMPSNRRCLIDTNVIIYARESSDQEKSKAARAILRACAAGRTGVLSTQVLLETYAVLSRGTKGNEADSYAAEHVARLAVAFSVLPTQVDTAMLAIDCSRRHGLHVFDSTLWAAAFVAGIPIVLTEDIGHRRRIDDVEFVNPFAEDFELSELGANAL